MFQNQDTTDIGGFFASAWSLSRPWIEETAAIIVLVLVAYLADIIAKRQLIRIIRTVTRRTKFTWDDALIEHRVFHRFAQVVPAAVIYFGIQLVPGIGDRVVQVVQSGATAFMVLALMLGAGSLLTAANKIYEGYPISKTRPIKGYVQIAKIALYVVGSVVVVAVLMDRSPFFFLGGLGAMTAVLLLVFRDTILSLVASVQIGSNDMVRVGDWVEMPKYGADGDVVDIALHTVKIQNWDKTITTVPTHKFIEDSFKNWRGMSESGGRRIKRAVHLDTGTVRFLTDVEVERFTRFTLLKEYMQRKKTELEEYNARLDDPENANVNGRRLTNIGTFRAYIVNYLKHHSKIHQGMTLLVRQLSPGPSGVPIEIYVFTNDTAWVAYEDIQGDVFDHIMAIVPEFGLRLYQSPSGADVHQVVTHLTESE